MSMSTQMSTYYDFCIWARTSVEVSMAKNQLTSFVSFWLTVRSEGFPDFWWPQIDSRLLQQRQQQSRNSVETGSSDPRWLPDEVLFKGPLGFSSSLLQFFLILTLPYLAESDGCLHSRAQPARKRTPFCSTWLAESRQLTGHLHWRSAERPNMS